MPLKGHKACRRVNIGEARFFLTDTHLPEFTFCQQLERGRIKDGIFLQHNVFQFIDNLRLQGKELRFIVTVQKTLSFIDGIAHGVVETPHNDRRPVEPFFLKEREKLVVLTCKMTLV